MGLEFARQLAGKGYNLLLVSNREEELVAAREELCGKWPVEVVTRCQDLSAPDAADSLHAWCTKEIGIVPDILINNAGMYFFKELEADDIGLVQKMLNLHVTTITRSSILFGADMKKRGSGHILIMSSMTARIPAPGITLYSATKTYLKSFGKSLSFELNPYGVGVTTVCPAAIATSLYKLKPSLVDIGLKTGFIHTPEWLVKRALRAMFRKRRVISPSFMNVWLPFLYGLLPGPLIAYIWKKVK